MSHYFDWSLHFEWSNLCSKILIVAVQTQVHFVTPSLLTQAKHSAPLIWGHQLSTISFHWSSLSFLLSIHQICFSISSWCLLSCFSNSLKYNFWLCFWLRLGTHLHPSIFLSFVVVFDQGASSSVPKMVWWWQIDSFSRSYSYPLTDWGLLKPFSSLHL